MRKRIFGVLTLVFLLAVFVTAAALEQNIIGFRQYIPWAAVSIIGFALFGWLSGALEFGPRPEDVRAAIRRRRSDRNVADNLPRRRVVTEKPDGTKTTNYR